jgi:two-component system, OmpR family, sensor histidine kinase CpxA
MSRIAVKIFLAFWLTFFVVVTSFSLLFEVLRNQEGLQPLGTFHQRQLEQHQSQMQAIYGNRGLQGLRRFAQDVETNRGITSFLLDDDGKDLLGRVVPNAVLAFFKENRGQNIPHMQLREGRMLLGPQAFLDTTPPATLLLWLPMAAGETPPLGSWWRGRYAVVQLGLGLLVSGLISLALALSLTRPLNRLKSAATRLAQGDFDSRNIDAVALRKDEIGALAKEFGSMANRLNAAMQGQQRLLRDVSHELRSPLTRLQVAIGLASRQAGAGNEASFERMEAECERLNALIGEVLALARDGNSDIESVERPFDLAMTLQALSADARFEAQAASKEVTLQVHEHLMLIGNEARLASAIENAVRNAIRYTAPNTEVVISATTVGDWVRIMISDAGPGLAEEELDKIFIPFYRVSQARERETGGTGVGLAIAAQAVQWHGGHIMARNRITGGLEIEMRLPRSGRGGAGNFSVRVLRDE